MPFGMEATVITSEAGASESGASFGLSSTDHGYIAASPWKDADVVAPSEMFAIMDTQEGEVPETNISPYTGWDWTWCDNFSPGVNRMMTAVGNGVINFNTLQHGKLFNVGFCDAHVSAIPIVKIFNPSTTARNWNVDHQPHPELWIDP